jgi:hypothetical protein
MKRIIMAMKSTAGNVQVPGRGKTHREARLNHSMQDYLLVSGMYKVHVENTMRVGSVPRNTPSMTVSTHSPF